MKKEEYLREIRQCEGFPRAILSDITVDKRTRTAVFHLITDVTYTVGDYTAAKSISQKYLPEGLIADVAVSKLVSDEQTVHDKILELLSSHSPIVAAFIRPQDVEVVTDGTSVRFCLDVTAEELKMLRVKEILDGIVADLNRSFCGSFTGTVREVEKQSVQEEDVRPDEEESEEILPKRIFPVCNYAEIDGGEKPEYAVYMADCNEESEELTVCGEIVNIQERQTGKGKPFFSVTLSDGSARMRITYFSKQATVEKVRALTAGDKIVCTGSNELFNGGLSYHAKKINRGSMPENFIPEERPKKSAPAAYHTVFPEPYEDYTQSDLFRKEELPAALTDNDFVVFDLETTGLNNIPTGGVMDSIIEIGAVKVKKGVICEKFSTFVAYDKKLPPDIVKLTGIRDEMLAGAPEIKRVIPDFYKFCDGCLLVGHNVTFDYRFVEFYAEKERYSFEQNRYDTMTLGQELLRLPNYKLNTLADYYGISFNHHRAFDDALTTAKIFIELIKQRKTLPEI